MKIYYQKVKLQIIEEFIYFKRNIEPYPKYGHFELGIKLSLINLLNMLSNNHDKELRKKVKRA